MSWQISCGFKNLDKLGICPNVFQNHLLVVFFFPRENQKCPWKPFLPIFSIFFTRGKSFSRALFSVFSRFLHGYTNRFHGRSLSKKLSFSRGKLLKIFHGHRFFFTGGIWRKSSRARFSFHGHFLGKNLVFSREDFFFFTGKKTLVGSCRGLR